MTYKAIFLDFYGTLVAEDDAVMAEIVAEVGRTSLMNGHGDGVGHAEIRRAWPFDAMCRAAFGPAFKVQRQIERESLAQLFARYQSPMSVEQWSQKVYDYWGNPTVFDDARWFLGQNSTPACIVSNIDNQDLRTAIATIGWKFETIVTSEDCRCYKPRADLFHRALAAMHCTAKDVLHVGDSLRNDVAGAGPLGIDVAWINRHGRSLPSGAAPTYVASDMQDLYRQLKQQDKVG